MSPFGWWIAFYFALATLASGVAGAACVLLRRGDNKSMLRARMALLISVGAISIGLLALIADLEHPAEFWLTLRHYNPASWISRGSRIAMLFAATAAAMLVVVRNGEDRGGWTQLGVPILAVLALALALYPSLVLAQELGRPNWQSAWLPLVFAAGAVHVGVNLLQLSRAIEVGVVALEAALLGVYLTSSDAIDVALHGTALPLLGLGVVFLWLLPTLLRSESSTATLIRSASMVLGGYGIRSVILMTGVS